MYAILLFGGPVTVNHVRGDLTVGNKENFIKLSAIPRIGILVNQLRFVLCIAIPYKVRIDVLHF